MNKQKKANIICIIIAIVIIIAGAIFGYIKGFNIELMYSNRQEIVLTHNATLDINKVKEIASSVLENKKVKVQKVGRFENSVQIISTEISDEEKQNIINKVNEEFGSNISNDDVEKVSIANTRIRDIIKPYIIPGVATFIIILLYFIIIYNKIGIKAIILKGVFIPIVVELVYFALIAITRLPFGRITSSIALGLYIVSIIILTICFQQEKEKLLKNNQKEND